jgi:response regulator of citrate/malate metabolism
MFEPDESLLATMSKLEEDIYLWLCEQADDAGSGYFKLRTLTNATQLARTSIQRGITLLEKRQLLKTTTTYGQSAELGMYFQLLIPI